MIARSLRCMLVLTVLVAASGCMATDEDFVQPEQAEADVEPTRIALKTGASAGPDDIDGFCEEGAGVYLSADGDGAQLMLYVVAPAEAVTFERPELRLITGQADGEVTEVREFASVTLIAGESKVLSAQAEAPLMDVVAEIETQVTPSW
jgi:hypothetical protein